MYYDKMMKDIVAFSKFQSDSIRQKMRNLRSQYTKTNDWRNSTGAGLTDEDSEKTINGTFYKRKFQWRIKIYIWYYSISDVLNKKCPFWNILDEIFSPKTNINPVAIFDSAHKQSESATNDELDFLLDDNVEFDFSTQQHDESSESPANSQTRNVKFEVIATGVTEEDSEDNKFAMKSRIQKKSGANSANSSAVLLEISQQRTEYHEKKLELEAKMQDRNYELENRKLMLEEKRRSDDLEVRKMEAQARLLEAENTRMQLMQFSASLTSQRQNFATEK